MYIDPVRYEGRPGNVPERLEKEQRCYALLDELQIPYARVDHEHADTIEACEAVEQVLGEKICKNLCAYRLQAAERKIDVKVRNMGY